MARVPSFHGLRQTLSPYRHFNSKRLRHPKQPPLPIRDFIHSRSLGSAFFCYTSPQFHVDPTVQSLLSAVSSCSSDSLCRSIHARVIKCGNYRDGFIGDRLVSIYAKFGFLEDARLLFDEMPSKDLVSWNSLISGFSRRGDLGECLNALCMMRSEMGMAPNEVTLISTISACTNTGALDAGNYIHGLAVKMGLLSEIKVVNALVSMYGKLGNLDLARQLFKALPLPNLVSWNSVITIYIQNGYPEEGIDVFKTMKRAGVKPDQATMVALLHGCADLGHVGKLADALHGYIFACGLESDIAISTALLRFYSKSGRLNASYEVFREMKNPDRIAWTAMLAGYAVHGYGRGAITLFDLMVKRGLKPDHVTFIHLLSACSHSGLVNEGRKYFEIMSSVYTVEPRLDHYSCMVDLLGRAGHLKEARALIESMPMEPNSGVWGALLNGCRVYRDIELGNEVAEKLLSLNPCDSRNYLLLSNIYSAAGQWSDASKVRGLMKKRGVTSNTGCSFIEHGSKIHRFVAGDQTHTFSDKIYQKLEELNEKIQEAGYVPKTEFVLHDVDEEVKLNWI